MGEFAEGVYERGEGQLADPLYAYKGYALANLAAARSRAARVLIASPTGPADVRAVAPTGIPSRTLGGPWAWRAVDYARLGDARARLLWYNAREGRASLWALDSADRYVSHRYVDPPISGFEARAYRELPGSRGRILWAQNDGALISEWTPTGRHVSLTLDRAGPGWHAVSYDEWGSSTRLLWRHDDGRADLWRKDGAQRDRRTYGPYSGWTARSYVHVADGSARLLWEGPNGSFCVWRLDETDAFSSYEDWGNRPPGSSAVGYAAGS